MLTILMAHKKTFMDKIRSKSIDLLSNNNNGTNSYQYIENLDTVSEEDCIKLDNMNRDIYKRNMELFKAISKKMETKNAMFKIDNPPIAPPHPNNHEKFIEYKLRNVSYNVMYQSYAVAQLLSKGYVIKYEKKTKENEFEPYEAIELYQKLEHVNIEALFKNKTYIESKSHEFLTQHSNSYIAGEGYMPSEGSAYSTRSSSCFDSSIYPQLSTSLPNNIIHPPNYYSPSAPPGSSA